MKGTMSRGQREVIEDYLAESGRHVNAIASLCTHEAVQEPEAGDARSLRENGINMEYREAKEALQNALDNLIDHYTKTRDEAIARKQRNGTP